MWAGEGSAGVRECGSQGVGVGGERWVSERGEVSEYEVSRVHACVGRSRGDLDVCWLPLTEP